MPTPVHRATPVISPPELLIQAVLPMTASHFFLLSSSDTDRRDQEQPKKRKAEEKEDCWEEKEGKEYKERFTFHCP
jgi:hypothetical protein